MIVQSMWIGPLTIMEQMCLRSYVRQGHSFELYVYSMMPRIPDGVTVRDAAEIVPIERVDWFPSSSVFSDYFRYSLLREKGGMWVDADTVCLAGFDDLDKPPYVFASDNLDQFFISGNFMKTPAHAPIVEEGAGRLERMTEAERAALGHLDPGPYWLQTAVPHFKLLDYVQPKRFLDPIPYTRITQIVDPARTKELQRACYLSYAIHLRRSIWNEGANSVAGILPDGTKLMIDGKYPEGCLWEQLKRDLL